MSKRSGVCALVLLGAMAVGCATPAPTPAPTQAPSPTASAAPSVAPAHPSPAPTVVPSAAPSPAPTVVPSAAPSPAPSVASSPAASGDVAELSIEARDLSFTPRSLEASAGGPVTLTLHNAGRIAHNVTIDDLDFQQGAAAGITESRQIADLPAGTYTFYCSVSGHRQAGMEGTLTVH